MPSSSLLGAVLLVVAGTTALDAPTPAIGASAAGSPPGCSTAVGAAPRLRGTSTTFVGTSGTSSPRSSSAPFGVAVTHDGHTAFVADSAGAIDVFSLTGASPRLLKRDPMQGDPVGLALTPDGRELVAASGSGLVVFNVAALERGAAGALLGTMVAPGGGAIETVVSPDSKFAFVTLENSQELAVFDLAKALASHFGADALVGTVPLELAPVGMAISPDGRYLYATSEDAGSFGSNASSDEGTLTTIGLATAETSPLAATVSTVLAGCEPVRVVADAGAVYVTARASDSLLAFSPAQLVHDPGAALIGHVSVGEAPVGLALARHDSEIIVADSNRFGTAGASASLAVVDARGGALHLVGYLPTGLFPRDMATTPSGNEVLVSDFGSGQLETVQAAKLP